MKKLICTLAMSLSLLAGAAPAEAAPAELTVMTVNVHGGMDRAGGGNHGKTGAVSRDILALVSARHPAVIALQEMCGTQYRDLRKKLAKLGYSGTFTNIQKATGCNDKKHGNQSGNGIFIKGKIQTRYSYALPWGANTPGTVGRQPRRLLCVKPKGQDWRACVTHLSPRDPDVSLQASKVVGIASRWPTSRVIIAGDLNLSPKYAPQRFPGFNLAGPGIDHILSGSPVSVVAVDQVPSSDHPALTGLVKL